MIPVSGVAERVHMGSFERRAPEYYRTARSSIRHQAFFSNYRSITRGDGCVILFLKRNIKNSKKIILTKSMQQQL
jgi:hypothetical protein